MIAVAALSVFLMAVSYIGGFRAGERRAERRQNHATISAELTEYFAQYDEPRKLLTHDTVIIPAVPMTAQFRRVK